MNRKNALLIIMLAAMAGGVVGYLTADLPTVRPYPEGE